MKKRILAVMLLTIFALTASGCNYEVFNRKFVRKKKKPAGPPSIYHIEPFVKAPNAETYSNSFLFWKTWEEELLNALTPSGFPRLVNKARVEECLDNSVLSLDRMKSCLNEAKAQELAGYIQQLRKYSGISDGQDLTDMVLTRMRQDIESHKRNVQIRFCFSAVRQDIAPDAAAAEAKK